MEDNRHGRNSSTPTLGKWCRNLGGWGMERKPRTGRLRHWPGQSWAVQSWVSGIFELSSCPGFLEYPCSLVMGVGCGAIPWSLNTNSVSLYLCERQWCQLYNGAGKNQQGVLQSSYQPEVSEVLINATSYKIPPQG